MAARSESDLGSEVPSVHRCILGGFLHTQEQGILPKGLLSTHYPPGLWEAKCPGRVRHLNDGNGKKQIF